MGCFSKATPGQIDSSKSRTVWGMLEQNILPVVNRQRHSTKGYTISLHYINSLYTQCQPAYINSVQFRLFRKRGGRPCSYSEIASERKTVFQLRLGFWVRVSFWHRRLWLVAGHQAMSQWVEIRRRDKIVRRGCGGGCPLTVVMWPLLLLLLAHWWPWRRWSHWSTTVTRARSGRRRAGCHGRVPGSLVVV